MCKNVCFTVTAPAPTVTIFKNLPWFDCWELLPYFLMFWWSWTFFSPTCILIVFFLWDFQWFVSLAHLHFGNSGLQFTVCVDSLYYKDLRGLSFFSGGKKWKNQTRILSETHNTECLVNFSWEACFPFTDLLSGVQPLGWPCLPIVGMEVDRKWKVVLGGSVMLRNENKTLARVFDELSESLEHRENYSVETLA